SQHSTGLDSYPASFDHARGVSILAVSPSVLESAERRRKMAFPFKSILVPVDFDQSSLKALELAAKVARQNNGKVFVVHIVPVDIDVSGMPQYAELITHQGGLDRRNKPHLPSSISARCPG